MFGKLRRSVVGADIPTEPVVIEVPDARFGTFTVTGQAELALPDAVKRRVIWYVPPPDHADDPGCRPAGGGQRGGTAGLRPPGDASSHLRRAVHGWLGASIGRTTEAAGEHGS